VLGLGVFFAAVQGQTYYKTEENDRTDNYTGNTSTADSCVFLEHTSSIITTEIPRVTIRR
jgi:hypothetical protein